jgi:hypothetical protein
MSPRRVPLLIVLTPVAAGLVLQIGLGLFVVHPPALGWIGLVVATIGLAFLIALLFTGLFSDTRANAVRLPPRGGPVHRLLIVVEGKPPRSQLLAEVQRRIGGGPYEVFVVAPVGVSVIHFLGEDQRESRTLAGRRLAWTLAALHDVGIPARGAVGTDEPLQAIGDALASFPADEILSVDGDDSSGRRLERRLERKARDLFGVPASRLPRSVAA